MRPALVIEFTLGDCRGWFPGVRAGPPGGARAMAPRWVRLGVVERAQNLDRDCFQEVGRLGGASWWVRFADIFREGAGRKAQKSGGNLRRHGGGGARPEPRFAARWRLCW